MKHVFHHEAVVSKLKYYGKQCDDVDVVQRKHPCFLLQFMIAPGTTATTNVSAICAIK